MQLPSATSPQLCLRGPADGMLFEDEDTPPPSRFIAAVHHGDLCCGVGYDDAESHADDDMCDCLPPSRGLYILDLDRSFEDGARWVYVYEREVFVDLSDG